MIQIGIDAHADMDMDVGVDIQGSLVENFYLKRTWFSKQIPVRIDNMHMFPDKGKSAENASSGRTIEDTDFCISATEFFRTPG